MTSSGTVNREVVRKHAKSRAGVLISFLKTVTDKVLRAEDLLVVDEEALPLATLSNECDGFSRLLDDAYCLLSKPITVGENVEIAFSGSKYLVVFKQKHFTLVFRASSLLPEIKERLAAVGAVLEVILTAPILDLESIDKAIQTQLKY